MPSAEAEISSFLKARRAALDPDALGLPGGLHRRRVRGLRREEVAQLAGISVDYYTRIEQGRAPAISDGVLDALAGALRLTGGEATYLRNIASHGRRTPDTRGPDDPGRTVRPEVRQLLHAMDGAVPAMIFGRGLDVLAWNALGGRIGFDLDAIAPDRRNSALLVFLDPAARTLHPDWERVAEQAVGALRAESGRYPDDPRIRAVVGELLDRSTEFRTAWEAQAVSECRYGVKRIVHPQVGALDITFESLRLAAEDDQLLVTYSAQEGSLTETRLRELARRVAVERVPAA
ncbi:helix-turn-helix domain-containing protein [Streptomyces benahoarensis]|uniref:Helix-turn-helix transcriptional regulator n=1 Tax=Streptomyces benahoarensis TaxID=2595054 RepID=A0A553ZEP6_9ACTN|nr:helix-turn-helix domain-containing protein [Streptomyces benahoarensis]TSB39931.1 helix-turn-helix transcriptional regulator [Streptomyces benahoarensis]